MKRLYILAGANGSGKSTVARVLLPEDGIVYVNPDDIARYDAFMEGVCRK